MLHVSCTFSLSLYLIDMKYSIWGKKKNHFPSEFWRCLSSFTSRVALQKLNVTVFCNPFYVSCSYSLTAFRLFSPFQVFQSFMMMCLVLIIVLGLKSVKTRPLNVEIFLISLISFLFPVFLDSAINVLNKSYILLFLSYYLFVLLF